MRLGNPPSSGMHPLRRLASPLLLLALVTGAPVHGPGQSRDFQGWRVLFIGIDGGRTDALTAAMERGLAPQMQAVQYRRTTVSAGGRVSSGRG